MQVVCCCKMFVSALTCVKHFNLRQKWTLVVVGLADKAGVAVAGGVNIVKEAPE